MITETFLPLLALFLVLAIFAAVLIIAPLWLLFAYGYRHYYNSPTKSDVAYLNENFPYFRQLDHEFKRKFIRRVYIFARGRRFVSKLPDTPVDRNQKLLISAAAAQLTFGLKMLSLPLFRTVVIHPKMYHSPVSGNKHLGDVQPKDGVINLSWEDFLKGYRNDSDAINLGLHEMAHALRMENKIKNGAYNFLNYSLLVRWRILADDEINAMRNGYADFFRDYAATNQEEFFAVAVEYFFERPQEFSDARPMMYTCMKDLLRQDPLNPKRPLLRT